MSILSFINFHTVAVSFIDFFYQNRELLWNGNGNCKDNDHFVLVNFPKKTRERNGNGHVASTKEPL